MTIVSSHILSWPEACADSEVLSTDTPMLPPEECVGRYVSSDRQQESPYAPIGERLLHEVVESIQHRVPLDVDRETQQLLDAAIEHQQTGPCDDIQAWESRLADDVKDADD